MPKNAFRYALEGRSIRYERLVEICDALDLDIHFTPRGGALATIDPPFQVDKALLSDIIYGVIVKAAEDGAMLRFEDIAAEASRIYEAAAAEAEPRRGRGKIGPAGGARPA